MRALKIFAGFLVFLAMVSAIFGGWLAWHHRPYAKPDWQTVFAEFEANGDCEAARYLAFRAGDAGDIVGYKKALALQQESHACSDPNTGRLRREVLEERIAKIEATPIDPIIPIHSIDPATPFGPFVKLLRRQWVRDDFPGTQFVLAAKQMWVFFYCFNTDLTSDPIAYHEIEHALESVRGLNETSKTRRTMLRNACAKLSYRITEHMKPYVTIESTTDAQKIKIKPYFYENWLLTARKFGSLPADFDKALLNPNKKFSVRLLKELAYNHSYTPALLLLADWYFYGLYTEKSLDYATDFALIAQDQGAQLPQHLVALVDDVDEKKRDVTIRLFKIWRKEFVR